MQLYNKIDKKELKHQMFHSTDNRTTISFYQYAHIREPQKFRDYLFVCLSHLSVLGRIHIAKEGINAQISILSSQIDELRIFLDSIEFLKDIRLNVALEDSGKSFFKLKIKVRNKILADGLNDETFDVTNTGKHLNAASFNALTADTQNTILIDMRNHYESEIGYFKNAIKPDVDTFRDSLPVIEKMLSPHKDKNVVMYCTGGIRCEKASAYFKHKGIKNVYQLEGGIIKYAQDVKANGLENRFVGKNFVFDERLGERISDDIVSCCHQCGQPCDEHTNCNNEACHLLFIQCTSCKNKYQNTCSTDCMKIIQLPLEEQKKQRKGINKGRQVFKKGRSSNLKFKER